MKSVSHHNSSPSDTIHSHVKVLQACRALDLYVEKNNMAHFKERHFISVLLEGILQGHLGYFKLEIKTTERNPCTLHVIENKICKIK